MSRFPVVVLGSSNTDLILRVERIPGSGETLLGRDFFQAAGGKGANQAVAAKRAGADVYFIGATGDDLFGHQQRQTLASEGLHLDYLRVINETPSGVALIFVDSQGGNSIGVGQGANALLRAADITGAAPAFQPGAIFVTQWETSPEAAFEGLQLAKTQQMTTIFNAAPADPRIVDSSWLSLIDILVVNESEAAHLLGSSVADATPPESLAPLLLQRGAKSVVLTLGEKGLIVASGEVLTRIAGHRVKAVDTVAAGDTFVGALACRLAEGVELTEACHWANRAAAIAVTRHGAQPSIPYRDEIEAFQDRMLE